jgi:hypothetical protein
MTDELDPELLDQLEEDAYIRACEITSPTAPEFARMKEKILENLIDSETSFKKRCSERVRAGLVLVRLRRELFDALLSNDIEDKDYYAIEDALKNVRFE